MDDMLMISNTQIFCFNYSGKFSALNFTVRQNFDVTAAFLFIILLIRRG